MNRKAPDTRLRRRPPPLVMNRVLTPQAEDESSIPTSSPARKAASQLNISSVAVIDYGTGDKANANPVAAARFRARVTATRGPTVAARCLHVTCASHSARELVAAVAGPAASAPVGGGA